MLMMGQFPSASVHDVKTYLKSVAKVFDCYPEAVVIACCDPTVGIVTKVEKVPNIKVLTDWLRGERASQETRARYAAIPKPTPISARLAGPRAPARPNLFVPDNVAGYAAMLERHEVTSGVLSKHETRVCLDGEKRTGIWVPVEWRTDRVPAAGWKRPEAPVVAGDVAKEAAKAFE